MKRHFAILSSFVIATALTVPAASADEFRVTSLSDLPDLDLAQRSCTTTEGRCTLRAAVMQASVLEGSHLIRLGAGEYHLTGEGGDYDMGALGDLDIGGPLSRFTQITIRGEGPPAAYCDGFCAPRDPGLTTTIVASTSGDRVFDIWPNAPYVVIEDLAITGGAVRRQYCGPIALDDSPLDGRDCERGGAIRSYAPLALSNVAVYRNTATDGGGIFSRAPLWLTSVAVNDNSTWRRVTAPDLGAPPSLVFCGGGILHASGALSVVNSIIAHNVSFGGGAGILTLADTGIIGSTVSHNFSLVNGDGGGIRAVLGASDALVMLDSIVSHNVAGAGNGGGISLRGFGEFHNVRIERNRAASPYRVASLGNGGGLAVHDAFPRWPAALAVRASDLTVAANSADYHGGGIYLGPDLAGARTEIFGATISRNTSRANGYALYAERHDVALTNVTISRNAFLPNVVTGLHVIQTKLDLFFSTITSNPDGRAAITVATHVLRAEDSDVVMKGNLFFDNPGGCQFVGREPTLLGGNLSDGLDDYAPCRFDELTHRVSNADIEPWLRDNGGPTRTHALPADSFALDRISPANCTAASGVALTVDQRGFPRPAGARCDSGAYERFTILWSEGWTPRFTEFLVLADGARLMLGEMARGQNPNLGHAERLVWELDLVLQKIGAAAETFSPSERLRLVDELAADLSRVEQVRRSFDIESLGGSAVRWKSLGLLGARARQQLAAVRADLTKQARQPD